MDLPTQRGGFQAKLEAVGMLGPHDLIVLRRRDNRIDPASLGPARIACIQMEGGRPGIAKRERARGIDLLNRQRLMIAWLRGIGRTIDHAGFALIRAAHTERQRELGIEVPCALHKRCGTLRVQIGFGRAGGAIKGGEKGRRGDRIAQEIRRFPGKDETQRRLQRLPEIIHPRRHIDLAAAPIGDAKLLAELPVVGRHGGVGIGVCARQIPVKARAIMPFAIPGDGGNLGRAQIINQVGSDPALVNAHECGGIHAGPIGVATQHRTAASSDHARHIGRRWWPERARDQAAAAVLLFMIVRDQAQAKARGRLDQKLEASPGPIGAVQRTGVVDPVYPPALPGVVHRHARREHIVDQPG
ncbi:hypothetical protein D9M73_85400 [compost metagenome]